MAGSSKLQHHCFLLIGAPLLSSPPTTTPSGSWFSESEKRHNAGKYLQAAYTSASISLSVLMQWRCWCWSGNRAARGGCCNRLRLLRDANLSGLCPYMNAMKCWPVAVLQTAMSPLSYWRHKSKTISVFLGWNETSCCNMDQAGLEQIKGNTTSPNR